MSRRGSFGLRPRVAPNVSGQIIALAREYEAKRDSTIMDAWRNGGMFEGKKVTDDMVLAYWRGKGKDLDKNDPSYEAAKNQIMQLEYGIAQSKADVLHVQGKMSDTAYAQFFLKWAQKVPRNSEFYRTLQKDAAQLIESSKAKSRANGERARTEAFNSFVTSTTAKDIAIGDAMTAALTDLSKSTGLSITGNGDELLAKLTTDVAANPQEYRRLLDTIKRADPGWDGQLTSGYFNQHIKAATEGYALIADRAHKAGFVSAYASAVQGEAGMANWAQNTKVWPVAQQYTQAQNAMMRVVNDPNSSIMDRQAATSAASATFLNIAKTPGIDIGAATMITADAERLLGKPGGDAPSFGTSMLGRAGVDENLAGAVAGWTALADAMKTNPTAYAYAPVDAGGNFDPTGKGALGIVPAGAIPPGATAVMVPGASGTAVLAMVLPHSVYSIDPNNPSAEPKLSGFQLNYKVGGKQVTMWGYKDQQQANHWSLVSPLADGATTQTDNRGDIFVTPQASAATDPLIRATALDAKYGTQLAAQITAAGSAGLSQTISSKYETKDASGKTITVELKFDKGSFTGTRTDPTMGANASGKGERVISTTSTPIDLNTEVPGTVPTGAATAFSPSALTAGHIPGVTFNSTIQASVQASRATQTYDQVSKFASDPAFQQAFLSQTMQTLGTTNPNDPRIADAWKGVTTFSEPRRDGRDGGMLGGPAGRGDLSYPAPKVQPGYDSKVTVNFGGQQLTMPGLPSYLKDQQVSLAGGGSDAGWKTASPWANLIPGLGLPQQTAAGSPAPVVTPGPTSVSPSTTPVPSALPTPTPTPAPTASPAPSPVTNWNERHR